MSEIKQGDIVELKSGGPTMTVARIYEAGGDRALTATCQWFEGLKAMKENFPVHSLKIAEE